MTATPPKQIRRFPRLMGGKEGGVLHQLLRSKPVVTISLTEKKPSIVFNIQIDASTLFPELRIHQDFFRGWKHQMEQALQRAYERESYNSKPISGLIANLLSLVVREALRNWLIRSWSIAPEYAARRAGQLAEFAEQSESHQGPQPDSRIALWVASQWPKRLAAVRELRTKFKSRHESLNEAALIQEFRNCGLPHDDIQAAFRSILKDQHDVGLRAFFTVKVTPSEIVSAWFSLELKKLGVNTSSVSVETHRRFGKTILKCLSELEVAVGKK